MNFKDLIAVLGVQRHEIEVQGVKLYVQLPTVLEYAKCDSQAATILNCIVDEQGNKTFSTEDEVNQIDFKFYTQIYRKINDLLLESIDSGTIEAK